ncbi:MbtH family NRPS accessory protein [Streptomyces sp. RPT161]|uniref:MbtH family NRPS accessory protein n=1 Tax=Streptomyces sp. RPT161 TaxID=3015993 RepID=UPI0022B91C64|nr:MbtH family NRPS accessory protein [Streptomyces sp. RPT161]
MHEREGQHSLWLAFAKIPASWMAGRGEDTGTACLEYVEQNWTDLRPLSLEPGSFQVIACSRRRCCTACPWR